MSLVEKQPIVDIQQTHYELTINANDIPIPVYGVMALCAVLLLAYSVLVLRNDAAKDA